MNGVPMINNDTHNQYINVFLSSTGFYFYFPSQRKRMVVSFLRKRNYTTGVIINLRGKKLIADS
jgi:hypothetical protein